MVVPPEAMLSSGAPVAYHAGAPPFSEVIVLRRFGFVSCLICLLLGAGTSVSADEATQEDCSAAVDEARAVAVKLPADDVPRYYAERHLLQALVEAGNGEFDDCLVAAEHAKEELRGRYHTERPRVLESNETPQR